MNDGIIFWCSVVITSLYSISLLVLLIMAIIQAWVLTGYLFRKSPIATLPEYWPSVTVQLPLYNEPAVVERLLIAISKLDYPAEKWEVQILDDSNDGVTSGKIKSALPLFLSKNITVYHLQRKGREGYKAGALEYGRRQINSTWIAIFDADFLPESQFLKSMIPYGHPSGTALVQSRWTHINRNQNLLTALQGFALDYHFTVEQSGRQANNCPIHFNGTAGIWKAEWIERAGGWQADTLTEDLDLSYRVQMLGGKLLYIQQVPAPAELPPVIQALRTQQHRWAKGAGQTARKLMWEVWGSRLAWYQKLSGTAHLLGSAVFVLLIILSVLSVPLLYIKSVYPQLAFVFRWLTFGSIGFVLFLIQYLVSAVTSGSGLRQTLHFIWLFPVFAATSLAISFHNGMAWISGFSGKEGEFVRTPKFNYTEGKPHQWLRLPGFLTHPPVVWLELFLLFYFSGGLYLGYLLNDYGQWPIHGALVLGLGILTGYTFFQHKTMVDAV